MLCWPAQWKSPLYPYTRDEHRMIRQVSQQTTSWTITLKIGKWLRVCTHPVTFDGQAWPNPPTQRHIGNMFQGMTLAYPLTLNHCQSLCSLGSLGNRNRSNITSPPICLALTREVHAVFMPVWDGFKLFSYQKAHSNILFERHCKPQISQPLFNHMSWFKRPESDLLPRRAVTVQEWGCDLSSQTTQRTDNQSKYL